MDIAIMNSRSHSHICKECGGYYCSFGGTTATREEVDAILRAGHENHFVRVTENCYITTWGKDGICPYQKGSACTIYNVQPLVCQKYPVVTFTNQEHFIAHCPLIEHLTEEDIDVLVELSSRVPKELLDGAFVYLQPYAAILSERMSKFQLDKISNEQTG
jgi:Fe-S-cluster containining protein